MKTKIIYISGDEVFNMADIRAAFEEVRKTLGLGKDTVMFGVPVDNDDALGEYQGNNETVDVNITDIKTTEIINEDAPSEIVDEPVVMTEPEEITTEEPVVTEEIPVEKVSEKRTKKSRTRKNTNAENNETEPDDEKIIPILSVLGVKSESEDLDITEEKPESDTDPVEEETDSIPDNTDEKIDEQIIDNDGDDIKADIVNMITDDAPEKPIEKTLEQLLETMTPLREDTIDEVSENIDEFTNDISLEEDIDIISGDSSDDTDATLEQLANEFAENQDKIPETPKQESHSKIGKLKNILPFKKSKRDDTGLMGDLFGWAGVAANDDDFSMPGFFTKTASKK